MGLYIAIIAAAAVLAPVLVLARRHLPCSAGYACAGVLCAALACGLCVFALQQGALYAAPMPDPSLTVQEFMDAVCREDYDSAYALLDNYASLGLEDRPEEENAAKLYDTLRQSCTYRLAAPAERSGLTARQKVVITRLYVPALTARLHDRVDELLAECQETMTEAEMVDETGVYRSEFTDRLYADALDSLLAEQAQFLQDAEVELRLSYDGSRWSISADPALFTALCGGV